MRKPRPWVQAQIAGLLPAALLIVATGCDFSGAGLSGAATQAPSPARSGGTTASGGRAPAGQGGAGAAPGIGTLAGGTPGTPSPGTGGVPPVVPPADAGPDAPGGSSGIATIDAGSADAATPPPAPTPTPTPGIPKGTCPVIDESLLLCLRFEGNLVDDAPPPTLISGDAVGYEAGPTGQAARVTGGGVRAERGLATLGDLFTLEIWARPDRLPAPGTRAALLDKDAHVGLFLLPGGDVACYVFGAAAVANGAARAGQWFSATCTAEGPVVALFIDGVRRADVRVPGPRMAGASALAIGSNFPTGDDFPGLVDNVRVWRRARSPEQICEAAHACGPQ